MPTDELGASADPTPPQRHDEQRSHDRRTYARFALMIATSTTVMFALTYTNSYALDHVRWSEERFYMALLMGGAMALVMFAFMRSMMYQHRTYNVALVALALVFAGGALYLSRSQALVDDTSYMRGMIPHHSIAILTSERAGIEDLRVRELADGIIQAQRKEIAEMTWLIDDIEANGPATTQAEGDQRPVPDFAEGLGPRQVSRDDVLASLGMVVARAPGAGPWARAAS